MAFSHDVAGCVGDLLTRRLEIAELERRHFASGSQLASSVVNSYRLLLVRSGQIRYTLEDWTGKIGAGTLLLVPAWMKRGWRSGSRTRVDLQWVSFNPVGEAVYPDQPFLWKSDDPAREARALTRMQAVWKTPRLSPAEALMIEGELKALLGRLACGCGEAAPAREEASPQSAIAREVAAVAGWIEHHHARPDVLTRAMSLVRSSDHYFRTRFRERTGFTLGRYAAMVRLRRARYLLAGTSTPVKDIAWQVGFRDPLHFSRCYRTFWGRSPRTERR